MFSIRAFGVFVFCASFASIGIGAPPSIVSLSPAFAATDVDPATTAIVVTFDQDMASGFSWTGGGPAYPASAGTPQWVTPRTCVLPVKLEPAKYYRLGINSTSHQNFRSKAGEPAPPRTIAFVTAGASEDIKGKVTAPRVVRFDPPNGATNVDPGTQILRVTFDKPMGGGMSWTGKVPSVPSGRAEWDPERRTCTIPVKLEPKQRYRIGINSFSHRNFSSEDGIPVEPVIYQFETAP
ncbi:MAG: Ig-like domain-containing protein [Candidatus Sumerlaeaceae bacterium]|nr:Ig-like domain-containing protein [Candidatus Sumerlaeaceae bacterium]